MKRMVSLMLALTLALSLCITANAEVYTHPEAGYGFTVPERWMALDGQVTNNLLDLGVSFLDVPDEVLAMLDQVKDMPMALVLSPDFQHNIVVTMEDVGMEISPAFLLGLGGMLEAQYQSIFPGYVITAPMSLVDFGDWKGAMLDGEYEMGDLSFTMRQVFIPSGSYLFGFQLTASAETVAEYAPFLADLVASFFVP